MKVTKHFSKALLAALAVSSLSVNAGNVDAAAARLAAARFLRSQAPVSLKNAPVSALKLAHTEASQVDGNAYYVFNIDGGGWIVMAGDDRAKEVLAYGKTGTLDISTLPEAAKGYLNMFKAQIETMQAYKGEVEPLKAPKRVAPVEPLLRSINWAQQAPFNYQCVFNGTACSVGCAGLAMAQILYYWQYPKEISGLPAYSPSWSLSVPALPATTFDYDLIVDQYAQWTDGSLGWVPGISDESKQEVAKLCRYASQSCLMNFSPDGSGSNVLKQKNGFLSMGFHSDAKLVGLEAWPTRETWNTTDYTDEQWVDLINEQLEKKHPIPYSSEDFSDGHAFVVDGVDADGLYHVSWGWYGRGDGWFQYGAFNVAPTGGETYYFNNSLFMVIDLYPATGDVPPTYDDEPTFLKGDADSDGKVTIADVTAVIDYVLSHDDTGIDLNAADVDGDGVVGIADVTAMIDYLLGGEW